jgi:hypothetical protein
MFYILIIPLIMSLRLLSHRIGIGLEDSIVGSSGALIRLRKILDIPDRGGRFMFWSFLWWCNPGNIQELQSVAMTWLPSALALSESVWILAVTTTFGEFRKTATVKGLTHTNPVIKPFVIKWTPSNRYSPARTFQSPARLTCHKPNHRIQHVSSDDLPCGSFPVIRKETRVLETRDRLTTCSGIVAINVKHVPLRLVQNVGIMGSCSATTAIKLIR